MSIFNTYIICTTSGCCRLVIKILQKFYKKVTKNFASSKIVSTFVI